MGRFNFCFSGDFYWQNFNFGGELSARQQFYEAFSVFLMFFNFLRSQAWSRLTTREAVPIHKFITNNQASFHLWWKENMLNHQRVSKYYELGCRFISLGIFLFCRYIFQISRELFFQWFYFVKELLLLLLLLCPFIVFAQAVLNAEIFLLGELQLVAKGQEDAFTLYV